MISISRVIYSAGLCAMLAVPATYGCDAERDIDACIRRIEDGLNLKTGLEINKYVAAVTGITALIAGALCSIDSKCALPSAVLIAIFGYNAYRALHKYMALQDLDEIRRIIRRHMAHLRGY